MPRLPGKPKVLRDPIHGDIAFARDEVGQLAVALMDSSGFQRLRGIRQNGVTNLAFQGAEHSRFTHSIGASWLAGRMYDAAVRNSELEPDAHERRDVVLAALLHDVGHGPFSHSLEEALGKKHFHHEKMTLRFLSEPGSSIHELLDEHDPGLSDRLVPFIDPTRRDPPKWYHGIVSSQLDADRLDYLARDAAMTGATSHQFDATKLIESLGVFDNELVVDGRVQDIVETYLLALEQMYRVVYFHHTVRAANFVLGSTLKRAFEVARQTGAESVFPWLGEEDPLWHLQEKGSDISLEKYCALDEAHVWSLIRHWGDGSPDRTLRELAGRLRERRLLKSIDLPAKDLAGAATLRDFAREQTVALGLEADYFLDIDDSSRVTYKRYQSGEGSGGSIKLLGDDSAVPIEQDPNSVANAVWRGFTLSRLIVHPDIRDAVMAKLKEL